MTSPTQDEIVENMERCPYFSACSQNLCPLDLELRLRHGLPRDKCRWMREAKLSKVNGREFVSGGRVMPNAVLNFVPRSNVVRLNGLSRKAWVAQK